MAARNGKLPELEEDSDIELVARHLCHMILEVQRLQRKLVQLEEREKLIFEQLHAMRETIAVLEQIGPITERELEHGHKKARKT